MILRWQTDSRYYLAAVQHDLFGQLEVVHCWGGRHNRLGGMRSFPVADEIEADQHLIALHKLRVRRGYMACQQMLAGCVNTDGLATSGPAPFKGLS